MPPFISAVSHFYFRASSFINYTADSAVDFTANLKIWFIIKNMGPWIHGSAAGAAARAAAGAAAGAAASAATVCTSSCRYRRARSAPPIIT